MNYKTFAGNCQFEGVVHQISQIKENVFSRFEQRALRQSESLPCSTQ